MLSTSRNFEAAAPAGYGGDGPYALRPMYGNTTRALSGGTYRQGGRWLDTERANAADVDGLKEIASRLIFRSHPDMVRAAWVRGRRLEGPPGA